MISLSEALAVRLGHFGHPGGANDTEAVEEWHRFLASEYGTVSSPAMDEFVAHFAGIEFRGEGPGVECAAEDFAVNPALCVGEADRFRRVSEILGTEVFPVGEIGGGRTFMGLDRFGAVYAVCPGLCLLGRNPAAAIEAIVRGLRSVWEYDGDAVI